MSKSFEHIRVSVQQELSKTLLESTTITQYEKLSSRSAITWRIWTVNGTGKKDTCILKYMDPNIFGDNHQRRDLAVLDFLKELTAYEFFEKIHPTFPLRAQLVAFRTDDPLFFIIKDLGENEIEELSKMEEVETQVVQSLATLNATCRPYIEIYNQILCKRQKQIKSEERHIIALKNGIQCLQQLASHFSKPFSTKLLNGFGEIKSIIENPGPLQTLVHYDMINQRQCIWKKGQLYLIDFERAIVANALLDVSRILVPKLEYSVNKKCMYLTKPGFSEQFVQTYQRAFEEKTKVNLMPNLWNRSLSAALVYTTISEIGRMVKTAEKKIAMQKPLAYYLMKLVKNLHQYTKKFPAFHFMSEELHHLVLRS